MQLTNSLGMLRSDNYDMAMARLLTSRKYPADWRIAHCYLQVIIQLYMDANPSKEHNFGKLVEPLLTAYTKRPHCVKHYSDAIMGTIASQITSLTIVYSAIYSDADQRKNQSSASLAFVREFTGDRWIPA